MRNRLRVVRAERRISQLRTALAAGLDPTRFWRIENDLVEPSDAEKEAIARVLGAHIGVLWPGQPQQASSFELAAVGDLR